MDFTQKLTAAWAKKDSLVCVGLDPDVTKLPPAVKTQESPLFAFNKAIIDATAELVCAFKPNSAFYEALGADGIAQLKLTTDYIRTNHPEIVIIIDAKRADIGNTNNGYVEHLYDYLQADAVTLHPYLGKEALEPFLDRADKGSIILCRTSNSGAGEFQDLLVDGKPLYQHVARQVATAWNKLNNCALVVGGTYPEEMKIVREIVGPDMAFLVPGIGAQGGDIEQAVKAGRNDQGTGMIINSSRGIIYASDGDDFAEAARNETIKLRDESNKYR
jgi:orotidine-5'-phosphate decarboxylase